MNVVDSSGKTVAAETVPLQKDMSTDKTVPLSDIPNNDPASNLEFFAPTIDWDGVLREMRVAAAQQLAKSIVPHRVVVSKAWFKCGDANETCSAGLAQLGQSNFDQASQLFKTAIDALEKSPKRDPQAIAAAYWGLTLSQEFSGDYASASATIQKAIQLDPGQAAYSAEVAAIRDEQANASKLQQQGVAVAPTSAPAPVPVPAYAPAPAPTTGPVSAPAASPPSAPAQPAVESALGKATDAGPAKRGAAKTAKTAPGKPGGCTKDTECKGDRVCLNGTCVDAK
jgi:tetratricopeptide (TPR) repeat protein